MVVADNLQTIADLTAYLAQSGLIASGARDLDALLSAPSLLDAAVIFPDELDSSDLMEAVRSLRRERPRLLVILITSAPQHLERALDPDGRSMPPVVLPKPAFGWTVLDVIRGTLG